MTFNEILKDIKAKKFSPIYFFHGVESYYIDQLNEAIDKHALTDSEKSFNQSTLYGKDSTPGQIIDYCLRLPMMAERQVVFLKEAQMMDKFDQLAPYFAKCNPQTVLVINYKKEKTEKAIEKILKNAVTFEANPIKEKDLGPWIEDYIKADGYSISEKALKMLIEFLGTDLCKISNELEKLIVNKSSSKRIDDADIEKYIGISKDYNVFEFQRALGNRQKEKVYRMVEYFSQNPKVAAMPMVTAILLKFYSELYQVKSGATAPQASLAQAMGLSEKQIWLLKDHINYVKNYTIEQLENCLMTLHEYDMKSKGVGSSNFNYSELMKEMSYKLMR